MSSIRTHHHGDGDLVLLNDPVAQELLRSNIPVVQCPDLTLFNIDNVRSLDVQNRTLSDCAQHRHALSAIPFQCGRKFLVRREPRGKDSSQIGYREWSFATIEEENEAPIGKDRWLRRNLSRKHCRGKEPIGISDGRDSFFSRRTRELHVFHSIGQGQGHCGVGSRQERGAGPAWAS